MQVIRNLQITAGEFFSAVFDELAAEVSAAGGDAVTAEAFQTGFTQVYRPENPAQTVTFKIVEYQEDKLYKAARTSISGTVTITYEVAPTADGIAVTFTYDNPSEPKRKGLFGGFSELIFLRGMTDKLYGFQRAVINKKEGFVEKKSASPFLPDLRKSV